jgi:hypothetical protein
MRHLLASGLYKSALALLLAAGLGACSTPCQELGHKLCECRGTGTTRRTCENTVDDELKKDEPTQAEQDTCEAALKTCKAPSGISFCVWLEGEDAKLKCGIALPETP